MKVAELREALEERGLASDGLKAELQARLANHLLASPGPCEYLKLVQDAICSLDEKTGSSQQAIENFVMHKKTDDYDNKAFLDALKTGIAVVLASLLSICDPIYSFTATGGWAVVTVIVLSQRTVGATML